MQDLLLGGREMLINLAPVSPVKGEMTHRASGRILSADILPDSVLGGFSPNLRRYTPQDERIARGVRLHARCHWIKCYAFVTIYRLTLSLCNAFRDILI